MLTIQDFKKAVATKGVGFFDINSSGMLVNHKAGKGLQFAVATADANRNRQVRQVLVNALVSDAGGEEMTKGYQDLLRKELLGEDKSDAVLLRSDVKKLLDRHVKFKDTLDAAGPQEALSVDAADLDDESLAADSDRIGELFSNAGRTATEKLSALEIMKSLPADILAPNFLNAIKTKAEDAEKNLSDAYKLTGNAVLSDKGRKALGIAVKALEDLGENLRRVFNQLNRHGYDVPAGLESAIAYCMARSTEINSIYVLARKIKDSNDHEPELAKAKEDLEREERSVAELVAGKSLEMHGSQDFVRMISSQAKSLADRIAALERQGAEDQDSNAVKELTAEVEALRANVLAAGSGGIRIGNFADEGKFIVDRSLADAMLKDLNPLVSRLRKLSGSEFKTLAKTFIEDYFTSPVSNSELDDIELPRKICNKLIGFFDGAKDNAPDNYWERPVKDYLEGIAKDKTKKAYKSPALRKKAFAYLVSMLQEIDARCKSGLPVRAEHMLSVLRGKTGVGTVLAACAFGCEPEDLDTRLDDANLVSAEKLGKGGFNTVKELKYNVDGKEVTRVFKPEVTARTGMLTAVAANDNGVNNRVYLLNRATHKAAAFLKAGNVVDPITVGVHDGHLGFFMKKAESTNRKVVFQRMGDKQKGRITKGTLFKGLTDLNWVDWLTGQMDRHAINYHVSVMEDGTAVVKGIDNDAAFSPLRRGIHKFELTDQALERMAQLDQLPPEKYAQFKKHFKDTHKDIISDIKDDPPKNPPRQEIDFSKADVTLHDYIVYGYGVNSIALPPVISKSMHDILKGLKGKDCLELAKNIMGERGFTPEQYEMTARRLEEMIDYATSDKGPKVMTDDNWKDPKKIDEAVRARQVDAKLDRMLSYYIRDFALFDRRKAK